MGKRQLVLVLLICGICGLFSLGAKSCIGRNAKRTKIGNSDNNTFMINAPSNLSATAISFSQINLSWQDNSNNDEGFEIERSLDGITYTLLSTLNADTISVSDVGLSWSTTYYYRVRAMNTIGDRSEWSNTASATTLSILPTLVWAQIAAGGNHTLALTTNGTVWSWGYNDYWQLGIGDTVSVYRIRPALIEVDFSRNPFTGITSVAGGIGGGSHSIALKTEGTLWAWGAGASGQLGFGNTFTIEAPDQVGSDSDWYIIAAGGRYTIALKTNLTLWAWGNNNRGQLGDGTQIDSWTPRQIWTDSDWSAIACGDSHTIARKTNNTLWSCGDNNYGQLGRLGGTTYTPGQIGTNSDWSEIATGYNHTIALKTNLTLWAWGDNRFGKLGDGTQEDKYIPWQIGNDSDWSAIEAGDQHTLGLKTNNTIWAWGYNEYGQLGLGDAGLGLERYIPTQISPLQAGDWSAIAVGRYHTIGIKTNASIWVWGWNAWGQLGLSDTINRNIPYPLGSPSAPSSLIATALGLTQIELSWQDNANNETGFRIERKLNTGGTYMEIATAISNAVSWLDTGSISTGTYYCYRIRAYTEFGNGPYSNEVLTAISGNWLAVSTTNPSNQCGISAGGWHNLGIKNTGTIWAWGYNALGQLGVGNTIDKTTPIQITTGTDWSSVSAGNYHTLAIKTTGTLWAWGVNGYGRLGDGTTDMRTTPRQIGSESDWYSVSAGGYHTIGLKSASTLWAWGGNEYGQLGDGTTDMRTTPRQIGTESDWSFVTAGTSYTIGLKSTPAGGGTLWAWGWNFYGQLGDGTMDNRTTPRQIGTESDWTSVSAGNSHNIALKRTPAGGGTL